MTKVIKHGIWVWRPKFEGVIYLIADVCGYKLVCEEFDIIIQEIRGTNDELNHWAEYEFCGTKGNIKLRMAYDKEYINELVHIQISSPQELFPLINYVVRVEEMFFSWELEDSARR